MRIIFSLAAILCLYACQSNKKEKIFSTANLPSQTFTISLANDTIIKTANGAMLDIPKGSITSDGSEVTLEIKEAYSLSAMIKAGLVTASDGQPLSSGGMIYINAVGGKNTRITKPVRVAMPSTNMQAGMQLFKGDTTEGKINWTDPTPLPENEQLAGISKGKQIFQQNCSSCHALGKELTGPDLAHFDKRFSIDNHEAHQMKLFSHNIFLKGYFDELKDSSSGIYPRWNELLYACNLRELFGTVGQSFPNITMDEWQSIYEFVQSESNRLDLPLPKHASLNDCVDSCEVYYTVVKDLKSRKQNATRSREQLIEGNEKMSEVIDSNPGSNPAGADQGSGIKDRVNPESFRAQYYQFTIETFGWFNIDILLTGVDGVKDSELFVRIRGTYTERVTLHFIIPSRKVNVEGGPTGREKNEYAFYTKDGRIPLPQGEDCYILAVSEVNDEIAYSITKFAARLSQSFEIQLNRTSKTEFNKALEVFGDKTISVKVDDVKNATEIRRQDSTIKNLESALQEAEDKLKPKNCNCDCLDERPATAPAESDEIDYQMR